MQTKESSNRIHGGDLVRFVHSELEGELSADINYESNDPEVFVRKFYLIFRMKFIYL